jgi:hypothetical protein
MSWPVFVLDLGIVLGTLINVLNQQHNRRAGRNLRARHLVSEYAGHDFDGIRLLPLGREPRLPGPATVELVLDVFPYEGNPWRTAVNDAANSRPMALAEARKPEEMAESVERHGNSALVDFVKHPPASVNQTTRAGRDLQFALHIRSQVQR